MEHPDRARKRKKTPTWRCLFHGRWGCQYCGKPGTSRPRRQCAVCGGRALVAEPTCKACKNGPATPVELFDNGGEQDA